MMIFPMKKFYIDQVLNGVIGYLGVKTAMSLLTAICIWLLLTIVGVQYAVLWAVLGFLLNYIPSIGSILAAIPIVLQALLLNGFTEGIIVLVSLVVINVLIGNAIEPKSWVNDLGFQF